MPPRTSKFTEVSRKATRPPEGAITKLGLALALVVAGERSAHAQACCVAPGAAGVARLGQHETALAGADARAEATGGSFDRDGRFSRTPAGTHDVSLGQSIFATVRVLERGQLTLTVPFVETMRAADQVATSGGGLGDIRGNVRWDLVRREDTYPWPGVALLGGLVAPTGTAPESASDPLAAGATGTGATQASGGVALEQTHGPWLAGWNGTVTWRAERHVGSVTSSLAPLWATGVVGAYAWTNGAALSLAASWEIEDRAHVDGVVVPGSSRRDLRLTTAFQLGLWSRARLVASLYGAPPIPVLSAGQPAIYGISFAVLVPWT